MNKAINNHLIYINNVMQLASTCVSMMWNMSAPLPTSRLGILISTVEPGSLLGPLFIAWNRIRRSEGRTGQRKRKVNNTRCIKYSGNQREYNPISAGTWKVRLRGWKLQSISSRWTNREASMEFPYTKEAGVTTLEPQ